MTISELVEALEGLKRDLGDVECWLVTQTGGFASVTGVEAGLWTPSQPEAGKYAVVR